MGFSFAPRRSGRLGRAAKARSAIERKAGRQGAVRSVPAAARAPEARRQYVHRLAFVRSDSGPTRAGCAAMSIRSASTATARDPGRRRLGAGRSL